MVLLRTSTLNSANTLCSGAASQGINIAALNILTQSKLFFNLCKSCQVRAMASIPPSAFSAGRIRETQRDRDMKRYSTGRSRNEAKYFNTSLLELTPVKYNSKLMNSIWGFYNRYSPHNVKKINDAFAFNVGVQQSAATSTNKAEPKIPLSSAKLDNVWAAMNHSQSH